MYRHTLLRGQGALVPEAFPFLIHKTGRVRGVNLHDHDFWEFVYIYEGRGHCSVGEQRFPFRSRHIILTPPFVAHCFDSHGQSAHRQVSLAVYRQAFKGQVGGRLRIRELLDRISRNQSFCIPVPEENAQAVECSLGRIFQEFYLRPTHFEAVIALELTQLLIAADRFLTQEQTIVQRFQGLPLVLCQALKTIETTFETISGLDDIVGDTKMNRRYFIRLFKKHVGFTPIQYLNRVRIEKACGLLLHTTYPIVQIAIEIGFNDLRFFNRQFKRFLGVTPRQFRNRAEKDSRLQSRADRFQQHA